MLPTLQLPIASKSRSHYKVCRPPVGGSLAADLGGSIASNARSHSKTRPHSQLLLQQLVDFCGTDEVILAQTTNRMGCEIHLAVVIAR